MALTASKRRHGLSLSIVLVVQLVIVCPAQAKSLRQLFERVSPSVVMIYTKERQVSESPGARELVGVAGVGSGVLVSRDGKVITAAHVVQTADRIQVEFADGTQSWAEVVASEPAADLALLQLAEVPKSAMVAKLGDSNAAHVGDQVFVIGAPYGIGRSLSVGYLSARHGAGGLVDDMPLGEFFQTDTAINQGNSGGPMFNMRGEVIGIVSHILSQSGGFEGLGFVVTSNMARQLLLEEKTFWSGIQGHRLTGELARAFNVPQPVGVLVQQVAERSPAARLGLRAGNIRAEIDGTPIVLGGDVVLEVQGIQVAGTESYQSMKARISALRKGEELKVKVLREGRVVELSTYILE